MPGHLGKFKELFKLLILPRLQEFHLFFPFQRALVGFFPAFALTCCMWNEMKIVIQ